MPFELKNDLPLADNVLILSYYTSIVKILIIKILINYMLVMLRKLPEMMRLVLPRENPRPDRRPSEIQRCGERARAAAQGTEFGGTRASIAPGYTPCTVSGRCPVPGP